MQPEDPFTGQPTRLDGPRLPGPDGQAALLDGHRQRLRAFDQLGKKAAECGIHADKDRDLILVQEDEVSLLEPTGPEWAALGGAIRDFRRHLPVVPLERFGFLSDSDDPFEANTAELRRIGGGVEALAFADGRQSVYKFFLFREGGDVGATFAFGRGDDSRLQATAVPGSYRLLFEKLRLIHEVGMPLEIAGISPEGILVVKQTAGAALPPGTDVSGFDPDRLIPIPSRFVRADRDFPRLFFLEGVPWLVADTHDRNVVAAADGSRRIIDLVAAPLPAAWLDQMPLFRTWIERARLDPRAEALAPVNDDEL